ncbi:MAG: isochorismatase family cysteine hydrolase [Anaerolineae bacterium]|jgi:nicotinamidase-related amidase
MSEKSRSFLDWLTSWEADLPALELDSVVADPSRVALLSVDMVKGFCCQGPLASQRVADIIPALVDLLERAEARGVRHFLLTQDTHAPNAMEFSAFPPHAVAGTDESATIEELDALPFSDRFTVIPKNTISSTIGTALEPWLEAHPEVTTFVVVGNCTDLCVYQAAMALRLRMSVLREEEARVIVPADCVQTYHMPVEAAEELGALPHDGDLLHRVFLYHMALNGVEVVAGLT